MQQFRNSDSSLLSAIMSPVKGDPRGLREEYHALSRSTKSPSGGPLKPSSTAGARAIRRARKAGREKRKGKIQKETAKLRLQRERVLDTAAAFARIWFAGPPIEQQKVGVSAYDRVAQRVEKQVQNMLATGEAKHRQDAMKKIHDSMRETIRQHEVLLAEKLIASRNAAKQAQMDLLQARIDARTGHPAVG